MFIIPSSGRQEKNLEINLEMLSFQDFYLEIFSIPNFNGYKEMTRL